MRDDIGDEMHDDRRVRLIVGQTPDQFFNPLCLILQIAAGHLALDLLQIERAVRRSDEERTNTHDVLLCVLI